MPDPTIAQGAAADLPAVRRLVADAGLPLDGLGDHEPTTLLVARDESGLAGVAALEHHGRDGLLRSVVVAPARRRSGIGSALTGRALTSARESGLRAVYLLTEDAARFFAGHGFTEIGRDQAPPAVMRSVEWAEACPDTATPMMREV